MKTPPCAQKISAPTVRPRQPAHDFLLQAKGTLPESISASDLPKLNHALEFLFADLRRASKLYQGDEKQREGAAIALEATWRFVMMFEKPLTERLHLPLLHLEDALVGLKQNTVAPLLRPVPQKGSPPSLDAAQALRGAAAATVQHLQKAGFDLKDARTRVANELQRCGVKKERGSGRVTPRTIRNWCETVDADVSRSTVAAANCDLFAANDTARLATMSKREAEKHLLAALALFVRAIYPQIVGRTDQT